MLHDTFIHAHAHACMYMYMYMYVGMRMLSCQKMGLVEEKLMLHLEEEVMTPATRPQSLVPSRTTALIQTNTAMQKAHDIALINVTV